MADNKKNISESERFKRIYFEELQKVKERFSVKDAKYIGISEPKASRVLTGKQIDIFTLLEMASYCGYSFSFELYERG